MNILIDNAKDILFFFENNLGTLLAQIPYDPCFIHGGIALDVRYFSNLIETTFKKLKLKPKKIAIHLPREWVLLSQFQDHDLCDHQFEREAIFYFLCHHHVLIHDYEYVIDSSLQRAMAIPMVLFQNIKKCFHNIEFSFPLNG